MKLEIEISDLAAQMLGEDPRWRIEQLVEHEALRLYHIERSKPKPAEHRPPGRPRLDEHTKQVRDLGGRLKEIFLKRKSQLGERTFNSMLGVIFQRLLDAIEADDLEALLLMEKERPWTRKWDHSEPSLK